MAHHSVWQSYSCCYRAKKQPDSLKKMSYSPPPKWASKYPMMESDDDDADLEIINCSQREEPLPLLSKKKMMQQQKKKKQRGKRSLEDVGEEEEEEKLPKSSTPIVNPPAAPALKLMMGMPIGNPPNAPALKMMMPEQQNVGGWKRWLAKKPKPAQNRYKQLYKETLSLVDERYFVTASLDGEHEKPFVHVREYTTDGRATRSGIFFNSMKQIAEVIHVLKAKKHLTAGEVIGPFEQGVFLWPMPADIYVLGVQPPYEGKKMVTGLRLTSVECDSLLGHLKTIMKSAADADADTEPDDAESCAGSLAVM